MPPHANGNLERCLIIYNNEIAQLAMRVVLSRAWSESPISLVRQNFVRG